jgi:MFS transporter, AAHS family, 4-hydroxybenzoate transporter
MTPAREVCAVADLIDGGPWSLMQKTAAVLAACAVTLDGMDIQVLSLVVPQIARDWQLTKASFALLFALSLVSVATGTAIGGWLGDRFGRRRTILFAVAWFGAFTLIMASSSSLFALYVFRLISGLGIGAALPNAAAYIAEITPLRVRTAAVTATIVCIPLGGVVGGLIGAYVLSVSSWRMLIAIAGALPVGLAALLTLALPESPRFLATRGRSLAAASVLRRFGIRLEEGTGLIAEHWRDGRPPRGQRLRELLSSLYRRNTVSLWVAFCFCMISVYLVFNWLPSLLSNLGLGPSAASKGLATYNFYGIVGTLLLGIWMNHAGSRIPLRVVGIAAIASALWLALTAGSADHGSALFSFQIGVHGFFVNGVQTALYAMAAQIYPTALRARGVAAASAIGRVGAVLSAFLGGRALQHPASAYFFLLAGMMTCAVVSLQFMTTHLRGAEAFLARSTEEL